MLMKATYLYLRLEDQLMTKLTGLEDQLEAKQEEETSLRNKINKLTGNSNDEEGDKTKKTQDDELIADENIVPFDTDHVTGSSSSGDKTSEYSNFWSDQGSWIGPEAYKALLQTTDQVPWVDTI